MNYCEILFNIPSQYDNRTVFSEIEKDFSITYKDLKNFIKQYAVFFVENGINSGDVVALHVYNSIDFIVRTWRLNILVLFPAFLIHWLRPDHYHII